MVEKVGGNVEMLGTKLGESVHNFPGLTPIAKELSAIQKQVAGLESAKYELDSIRATLLLNFGVGHSRFNFAVADEGSTLQMVMNALEQLTRSAYTPFVSGTKPEEQK